MKTSREKCTGVGTVFIASAGPNYPSWVARSYDAVMNMFAAPVQWVDLPTKITSGSPDTMNTE